MMTADFSSLIVLAQAIQLLCHAPLVVFLLAALLCCRVDALDVVQWATFLSEFQAQQTFLVDSVASCGCALRVPLADLSHYVTARELIDHNILRVGEVLLNNLLAALYLQCDCTTGIDAVTAANASSKIIPSSSFTTAAEVDSMFARNSNLHPCRRAVALLRRLRERKGVHVRRC